MDSQSIEGLRESLLLNNNMFRYQIALFYFVSFSRRLLIKIFNEAISIQEDVVLSDFFLPGFLKGNIIRYKVAL
jgi:hypothetical protein